MHSPDERKEFRQGHAQAPGGLPGNPSASPDLGRASRRLIRKENRHYVGSPALAVNLNRCPITLTFGAAHRFMFAVKKTDTHARTPAGFSRELIQGTSIRAVLFAFADYKLRREWQASEKGIDLSER